MLNLNPLKMIPVKQTRLVTETQRGNCYAAAIASILEMECEDVFQVQEYYDGVWKEPLDNWLEDKGYKIVSADDFKAWHTDLWLHRFFETDGKNPYGLPSEQWREITCDQLQDEYYFVTGISPRNPDIAHIVIYQNGKMVHDPHPDNTGILTTDTFKRLVKI